MSEVGKEWTTVCGGAPVGDVLLDKLYPKDQVKLSRMIEDGANAFRVILGRATVDDKIAVGGFCHKLRAAFLESEFRQIVETHWLEEDRNYSSVERELQDCQAMYRFSRRKGPRLVTDIPIDSYRKIMQHIHGFKGNGKDTVKMQNARIREINQRRSFDDVSLGNTKLLREVLRRARVNQQAEKEESSRSESSRLRRKVNLRKLERLDGQIEQLQDTVNEILRLVVSTKAIEKATGMRDELTELLDKLYTYLEKKICL